MRQKNPVYGKAWSHGGCSFIGEKLVDFVEAYAEDLLDSTGELDQVPEHLRSYIDVEAYARDIELNGDVFTVEDGSEVHVFWGR
jgi:antirestriction protein